MQDDATQGTAILESRWPRVGLGTRNVILGRCIGRFAATASGWLFEDAFGEVVASGDGDPLVNLAKIHRSTLAAHPQAGLVGYIAYEFGYNLLGLELAARRPQGLAIPIIQFLFFDRLGFADIEAAAPPQRVRPKRYSDSELHSLPDHPAVTPLTKRRDYLRAVERIKSHIADGNIYQANLTQAFDVQTDRNGLILYHELAQSNPASFSSYLRFGSVAIPHSDGQSERFPEIEVVSCTPERFWRKRGRLIETRPIKGTIARSDRADEDRQRRRALLTSDKDRAELLMITDLSRNDLGRCAEIGSVSTRALRRIRACASVWHLESLITGTVHQYSEWHDVMRSLFPGGSITGAPKRRAVEILSEIETVPRGVYCGAIGWISADGDADFALAIRTLVKSGGVARVFGGGGIVADSDPEAEYHESLIKIAPMLECLCRNSESSTSRKQDNAQEATVSK